MTAAISTQDGRQLHGNDRAWMKQARKWQAWQARYEPLQSKEKVASADTRMGCKQLVKKGAQAGRSTPMRKQSHSDVLSYHMR
eukprot:6474240-Amphidinium_carterae.2